jgi:hypothetical protein
MMQQSQFSQASLCQYLRCQLNHLPVLEVGQKPRAVMAEMKRPSTPGNLKARKGTIRLAFLVNTLVTFFTAHVSPVCECRADDTHLTQ